MPWRRGSPLERHVFMGDNIFDASANVALPPPGRRRRRILGCFLINYGGVVFRLQVRLRTLLRDELNSNARNPLKRKSNVCVQLLRRASVFVFQDNLPNRSNTRAPHPPPHFYFLPLSRYNTYMQEDPKKEIFMLVDGSAIVHRAYHAMPPLTRADGTPTGAVQGFFSMILKVIAEFKPAHIAIAFDRPAPNFRKELFSGYQAQRPAMDSDLSPQFGIIQKILESAKIPVYSLDGLEADDVIGTIAQKAKETGHFVYILTGDRDMLQLVNHKTKVLAPLKGISEMTLYDSAKVKEKYGIMPEQFVEMKALMGDASDNYPGVLGIGPKTASDLIKEYSSISNIYKNLDKIGAKNPKLAEKLERGHKNAILAHQLATILTNAPFKYNFADCSLKNLDIEAFKKAMESYDFKTLPKRLDEVFKDGGIEKIAKTQMKLL